MSQNEDEILLLRENALKRKQTYEIYKDFIENIVNIRGRGRNNRLLFYRFIKTYSDGHCFRTEEDEYTVIGKLYRREWNSEEVINSFSKEDREIILSICQLFGCMDY